MMPDYQIDNLIIIGSTIVVLFAAGAAFLSVIRRRMAERQEVRRALLEKLSSEEMVRLAESESGRVWLRDMFGSGSDARGDLIRQAMQMIFGGVGCGVVAGVMHVRPIGIAGIILVAVGLGQLVAAALLARRDDRERGQERSGDEK